MSETLSYQDSVDIDSPPIIEFRNVCKSFPATSNNGSPLEVVRDFSLKVSEGELVTMFGPNGAGKTTILNMLAGILTPDSGEILKKIYDSTPSAIGYVFQNYSDTLLPWRTVRENVQFPLEFRNVASDKREKTVNNWLGQFNLSEHADKYVYELSGGLKQLVAIARATIYNPRLLLLDEPFSALDYSLSRMLWSSFRGFWAKVQTTTIFISHNVDEAVFLGDRVCVLSARPTSIIDEVRVPLGKNRSLDLLSSPEFFQVRREVLHAFERGRK